VVKPIGLKLLILVVVSYMYWIEGITFKLSFIS